MSAQEMNYRKETDFRSLEFKLNSLEQKFNLLKARLDQIQDGIEKFHLKPPSAQEIQAENVQPKWLRLEAAISYTGFSRSMLYHLIDSVQIRSITVKTNRSNRRGIRLIDRESLDEFILKSGEELAE
jgi:hypothetical protein